MVYGSRIKVIAIMFILSLLPMLFLAVGTDTATAAQDGEYTYTLSGSPQVATVTGYTGPGGARTIPSTLSGFSTVAIGDSAFTNNAVITSVTIQAGITTIGDYAFEQCPALTSVTIPSGVQMMGNYVFDYCTALTSVTIPSGVKTIGDYAFEHCTALTSVTIPSGVTSIGVAAFDHCIVLTSATIPDGVTSIGDYAFSSCIALPSVTIPDSLTVIGNETFEGCWALTSVTIPNSVTKIGEFAFDACKSMTSETIGSGVTSIGDHVFDKCSSLTSISFMGLTAPTSIGAYWLLDTPTDITGHALAASNFPTTGGSLSGLTMGSALAGAQTAPGAPTNLLAVTSSNTVILTWTAPADPGSPGIGWYIVYRGVSPGVYTGIGTEPPGATTFVDTTVTPGATYYYVVRATNSVGLSAPTNEVTVNHGGPTTPSAPQGLEVQFNPNNITLTWKAPAEDGGSAILRYNIYRSNSSGGHYTNIENVSASTLTYVDMNGTSNDSYSYYLVAVNSIGEGTQSSIQGKPESSSLLQAALPPVAAVAVGSSIAFIAFWVVGRASETAASVANSYDSFRAYLKRLFRLDKLLDFVSGYFKGRAHSLAWKQVEKVELESTKAVQRRSLFAGFSAVELTVILTTSVFLGLAFMITNQIDIGSLDDWLIYILVAGLAVIIHDLVHRYMAWRHNVPTEYKFWFLGTIIMFLTALAFGVVYSSPSRLAIEDADKLTARQQAIVYGSGPIVSFALFGLFMALIPLGGTAATIGKLGASMNLLTAANALMPFAPMDGLKVYRWKKWAWAAMFVPILATYFALIIFVL